MTLGALAYSLAPIVIMLVIGAFVTWKIRAARSDGNQRGGLLWLMVMVVSFLLLPVAFGLAGRLVD